ncbi:MAG: hypothetical protein NZ849_07535 [Meiothermus sp.]|uniref:hypothetical protein n=1 Tax=Meiothermus sp. TaxID=1955249 RepID=UPI0025FCA7AD|nr:hypothetical protein [Meiothermus sp.]MCS7058234.1 hypothetical protein [Meiothermus sp.]MCS7194745.1 hypothetical protein [Meiothermus sp.]MCX7739494.1 hypothetical protein [Meiothermus sp.]MDW8091402.1 hypothetical protein [Meiothermus sp.]MDW8481333.1 hypothetical protein [Meiothermus sp.]
MWRFLLLLLTGCAPVFLGAETLVVSERLGLVLPDARLLARIQEGSVEITEFYYEPNSGYRPRTPGELRAVREELQRQLETMGFSFRCTRENLSLLGDAYWILRMARGNAGVGLLLRPLEKPDHYRLEVAPTAPEPPLFQCPAR